MRIFMVTKRYLTVRFLLVTKRNILVKVYYPPPMRGSLGLTVRILMVTKRYLTVRFLMVTKRNLTLKEFYPSSLGDQEKFFGKRILPPPTPTQEHKCHAVTNFVFCVWPWDKYFW